ncbi:OmpA family protein [Azohydromonas aeria]|uniref:OmpA family protein n=1 Tax=Azohydromonas aeria TaxID=2590212 RepID=UPI0012F8D120|nr:OmpA family protein [Azohydromonas aeria]
MILQHAPFPSRRAGAACGRLAAALVLALAGGTGAAQAPQAPVPALPGPGQVVVSGTVPDEATRAAILARVRELYGPERVVDQLGVDRRSAPPDWAQHVERVLTPELRRVTQGRLSIHGNVIELIGRAESEAERQRIVEGMTARLANPTYTVRDGLQVATPAPAAASAATQQQIDAALARRTIEFQPGNATLTPTGQRVLEELLPLLRQLAGRRFEVVGHTDDRGTREANLQLSAARAETVRGWLAARGIPADAIHASGAGPDRPVADNATAEGRARNRRIELRVAG